MERLTFDGDFCDIAMCLETRGGSFCEEGACSQRKVWERLKYYEDLEKQGRLVVLPCKIDEPIYTIHGEKEKRKSMEYRVVKGHIDHFTIGGTLIPMITACTEDNEWDELIDGTQIGHEYWLTREEAEAALKEDA